MDGLDTLLGEAIPSAALMLARQFATGATMWCVSPRWPEHARHLAVEFVHPVIVGTRALPAVSVHGSDPIGALRVAVRPGDIVAVLGRADDADVAELLRRAGAWGATTLSLATGSGTAASSAHVTIEVDDPEGTAAHDGRLVLHYHLLWELTHVCFEHPGLLRRAPTDDDTVCVTCRDEGRMGEVVSVLADDGLDVEVRTADGNEHVDGTLVGPLAADDLVLIHAGTVIAKVAAS